MYSGGSTEIFLNEDTAKLFRKFAQAEEAKVQRRLRALRAKENALYSELYAIQDVMSATNHLVPVPDTSDSYAIMS